MVRNDKKQGLYALPNQAEPNYFKPNQAEPNYFKYHFSHPKIYHFSFHCIMNLSDDLARGGVVFHTQKRAL